MPKGVYVRKSGGNNNLQHGQSYTGTYRSWRSMNNRCTNISDAHYHIITVDLTNGEVVHQKGEFFQSEKEKLVGGWCMVYYPTFLRGGLAKCEALCLA